MHVKCRVTLRQTLPGGFTRPAEATDLGPSTANCIRSALDPQLALAEAIMADLGDLARQGSPSATAILDSFQPGVFDRTMSTAIKCGALQASHSAVEAVRFVPRRPSSRRTGARSVGAERQSQAEQKYP